VAPPAAPPAAPPSNWLRLQSKLKARAARAAAQKPAADCGGGGGGAAPPAAKKWRPSGAHGGGGGAATLGGDDDIFALVASGVGVAPSRAAAPLAPAAGAAAGAGAAAASAAASAAAAASSAAARRRLLGPFESKLTPDEARIVALDCEMVGVGPGGERSALAQVVVVDFAGRVLYSEYVLPADGAPVTDFRTKVSGVRPEHLRAGGPHAPVTFAAAQAAVAALLRGRTLVGHGLRNDLRALQLVHDRRRVRDTARYAPLCVPARDGGAPRPRRLQALAADLLGVNIQDGEHDPAEDARAALAVYKKVHAAWETDLRKAARRA
jgi:RNA exonuclease 4